MVAFWGCFSRLNMEDKKMKLRLLMIPCLLAASLAPAQIIIDHTCVDIHGIPQTWIEQAKAGLYIAYGHTSHGSQLTEGMTGLVGFMNGLGYPTGLYDWNDTGSSGALHLHDYAMPGDLGYLGDLTWATETRTYLDNPANSGCNVIMWSWCGGCSDNTPAGIQAYLDAMNQLETDYPAVRFVYMTGHLDIWADATLKANNQQIRDYCNANGKILYDFADIESYDPDGTYYEYANDDCGYYSGDPEDDGVYLGNWAQEWQGSHTENTDWYDCDAAHSEPLNANRKAYAAWWLWARLAGWDGSVEGEGEGEGWPIHITFTTVEPAVEGEVDDVHTLWRVAANPGAAPENLGPALDLLAPLTGPDRGPIRVSSNGAWYIFESQRFDLDAQGWEGLVLVPYDLSSFESIRDSEGLVRGSEPSVTADGNRIVLVADGGAHTRDVWVIEREAVGWSAPTVLTGSSPYAWNTYPRLSPDGTKVCFDCGNEPYGGEGTNICEVGLDGAGFQVVIATDGGPAGSEASYALHAGSYAPDGSLIFEAEWEGGEQIWRLPPGGGPPALVDADFGNDNSPVALPHGRIASLWLEHPDGGGGHHIKVMDADGQNWFMLTLPTLPPSIADVADIGLGAGGTAGEGETPSHSADQDGDNQISLSELLRVIQFYNSDGYHCEAGTEDGYAPGQGDTACAAHGSDYNTQDWYINLSELLRLVQFYNSAGYHTCAEGEDGFCPGPA